MKKTKRSVTQLHLLFLFVVLLVVAIGARYGENAFKVMSFNIRYGTAKDGQNSWPQRMEILFRTIEKESPEILGLQEALKFQIDEIQKRFPAFVISGRGRDDGMEKGEYTSILFKSDRFQLIKEETFWLSDTPDVPGSKSWGNTIPRICSWVKLRDKESDKVILVLNLHLDHRSQNSREKSVEFVLDRFKHDLVQLPSIMMGDLNAGEDNPAIQLISNYGRDNTSETKSGYLKDSFRQFHPEREKVGTFNGWKGRMDGPKIDYVFVNKNFLVRSAEIVDYNENQRYPSDHFPITAILEIGPGNGDNKR